MNVVGFCPVVCGVLSSGVLSCGVLSVWGFVLWGFVRTPRRCVTSLQLVNEKFPVGGLTLLGYLVRNYDWLVVVGVSFEHQ